MRIPRFSFRSRQPPQTKQIGEARLDLDLAGQIRREERPLAVEQRDQVVASNPHADVGLIRRSRSQPVHASIGQLGPVGGGKVRNEQFDDSSVREGLGQRLFGLTAVFVHALDELAQLSFDLSLRGHAARIIPGEFTAFSPRFPCRGSSGSARAGAVAILAYVLEDMRKYVRAGIQALSSEGPEQIPADLMSRAQEVADRFSALAGAFRQWSAEARESLMLEVRELVGRQVQEMGLATQKQVQALRARLDDVERQVRAASKPTAAPAGSSKRAKATPAPRPAKPGPVPKAKSRTKGAKATARAGRPSSVPRSRRGRRQRAPSAST